MLPDCGKVLMFHQVDNCRENWIDNNISITYDSFKLLIEHLIKEGKRFSSINEIGTGDKLFITFDDGFSDIYTNAYPVLKVYNIPFCIFITTGYINKENYLTFDMLKSFTSEPLCTIGSHTISHPLLRYERNIISCGEICKSKSVLEEYIGKEVQYFAFPYGSIYACSMKDVRNVQKAGYNMAFSALNSHLSEKAINSKFFIPRINVNEKNYLDME